MLRAAVLWFSSTVCRCLTRSRRRSSVSGGMGTRMSLPSLAGLKPSSAARMAFSMACVMEGSKGWTTMSVGSGVASLATWFTGVAAP